MEIRPVGAESHAVGRKDVKLIVAFRDFVNAPKKNNNQEHKYDECERRLTSSVRWRTVKAQNTKNTAKRHRNIDSNLKMTCTGRNVV